MSRFISFHFILGLDFKKYGSTSYVGIGQVQNGHNGSSSVITTAK